MKTANDVRVAGELLSDLDRLQGQQTPWNAFTGLVVLETLLQHGKGLIPPVARDEEMNLAIIKAIRCEYDKRIAEIKRQLEQIGVKV